MSSNLEIGRVILVQVKLVVTYKDFENENTPFGFKNT